MSAAVAAVAAGRAARMAAWRVHAWGGLPELRLEAARVPPLRAPDEMLVQVSAAGLNPIDVAMTGGYGRDALGALRRVSAAWTGGGDAGQELPLPLTCGRECSGRVVRAGPACRPPPGARVWAVVPPHRAGSHAQYVVLRDCWAGPAPSTMDDLSAGGALYAALTACAALRAAGLSPGPGPGPVTARSAAPRVLLLGLGGVGTMALQLLAASGAQVVVGCSGARGELAARLGACAALDRHASDYDRQLVEAGPYEAIIDCAGLGGREAGARGWRFGRYVTLTSPLLRHTDARGAAGALPAAAELAAQCARAGAGAGLPPRVRWAFFMLLPGDIDMLRRMTERGQLSVVVDRVYGWRAAAAAYERQAAGARGKILLDFTDDTEHHDRRDDRNPDRRDDRNPDRRDDRNPDRRDDRNPDRRDDRR